MGAFVVVVDHRWRRRSVAWRPVLLVVLASLMAIGAWQIFRVAYYGDWLPQTVRAKAGLSAETIVRGAKYVVSFALQAPAIVVVTAAAVLLFRRWRESAYWLVILGTFGMAVVTGGDWMPMGRLVLPAIPFLAFGFGHLLVGLRHVSGARALLVVITATLSLLSLRDVQVVPRGVLDLLSFREAYAWSERTEMRMLASIQAGAERDELRCATIAEHTSRGESIISGAVGRLGYYTELDVLDPLGLVSRAAGRHFRELSAPGHDFHIPPHEFFPNRPTYYAARLARDERSREQSLRAWRKQPMSRWVRAEVHPCALGKGEESLVLFRSSFLSCSGPVLNR